MRWLTVNISRAKTGLRRYRGGIVRPHPCHREPTARMLKPIRLRTLLFLVLTALSVGPVLMLGTQLEHPAMQKELEAVEEKHLLVAGHLTDALERYARDVDVAFRAVSDAMSTGDPPPAFASLIEGLHFRHICLVADDGQVIRAIAAEGTTPPPALPPPLREMVLNDTEPGGSVTFSPVMSGPGGAPGIFLTRKLPSGQFALAAIGTDYLVELQGSVAFGNKGHAAIVDQTGKVLAHPREEWRLAMKDISALDPVKRMMAGSTGVSRFYSPALEQEMVAGFSSVLGPGWGAMVPQPLTELEASARRLARVTLVMSFLGRHGGGDTELVVGRLPGATGGCGHPCGASHGAGRARRSGATGSLCAA